jgi:hypothetical protein
MFHSDTDFSDTLNVMMFVNQIPLQLAHKTSLTSTVVPQAFPLMSAKHPQTPRSQATMSNQLPLGSSTPNTRENAYISSGEEFSVTSNFSPNPTAQLPFSSNELGELPIHALSNSLNEPIAEEPDRSLPAFGCPTLSQANFDPYSFFDDLGIMNGSSVVAPDVGAYSPNTYPGSLLNGTPCLSVLFDNPSQNYPR